MSLKAVTKLLSLLLLLLIALFAAPLWAVPPRVAVSIKPVHALVAGVMQGIAEPELLYQGGQSPHRSALTPSQVRAISRADLLVWVGEGLERPLAKVVDAYVDTRRSLELINVKGMRLLAGERPSSRRGTRNEARKDERPTHEEGVKHLHGDLDPHIWLSPENARVIVRATAQRLIGIDAGNTIGYQENRDRLVAQIDAMEQRHRRQLEAVRLRPFIVFHDAYRYFEQHYGIRSRGAVTLSAERSPGARHLHRIRQDIKQLGARCLFSEPQFSPRLVSTLVEGTGVKTAQLDPVGANLHAGAEAYFELMDNLVRALVDCLSD